MAKKTKVMHECCPSTTGSEKPRLYLSLVGQDVKQLKAVAVGDEVMLHITGKVVGISQRERPSYEDSKKTEKSGDIDLEDYKVQIMGEEDNTFTKMAEDDE